MAWGWGSSPRKSSMGGHTTKQMAVYTVFMSDMTLSKELQWRNFVNQTTYQSITDLDADPITFYWGVDPSAPSLTIGNLAAAMMVRHFINHGHKAVLLVGGATGMIGDPDGKSQERKLQTDEDIKHHKDSIAAQYTQIFGGSNFTLVDNHDWFKDMSYLQFLRDIGKHVPMRQMLNRDFVQSRLGEGGAGISYAEFSYVLIQAYDFLHLNREMGVTLQVCGSDQWGNSIAGVDLIRRLTGNETHVWSTPLVINQSTGIKFGKSEEGAVWLDPTMTSVYSFYQFWLNVDDTGALDYLKMYTLLGRQAVDRIEAEFKTDPSGRVAQKELAYEVTKIVHGQERADSVKKVTEVLFGNSEFGELVAADINELSAEIPTVNADKVSEALVNSQLAASMSDAKRLIASGAVQVNGEKIESDMPLTPSQSPNGYMLLRRGKNVFALVK